MKPSGGRKPSAKLSYMENLELITDLSPDVVESIERTDSAYRRMIKVATDVLEYDPERRILTVRVKQFKKPTDKVFEPKELIQKGKEVLSHLPPGIYTLRFRPVVFSGEGLDVVSAAYVREQMKKHGLKQVDIVRDFGVDEQVLSRLLNGHLEFTRWHKSAFFYYFKFLSAKS